jgi:hypothetical protein
MPVHDTAFREIVGRKLDVDPVAGKNPDAVPAHAPGNVSEDRVAVFELYGKGRAGENLLDTADRLDRTFLGVLRGCASFGLAANRFLESITNSYRTYSSKVRQFVCQRVILSQKGPLMQPFR